MVKPESIRYKGLILKKRFRLVMVDFYPSDSYQPHPLIIITPSPCIPLPLDYIGGRGTEVS